jgi:hypothetical protein
LNEKGADFCIDLIGLVRALLCPGPSPHSPFLCGRAPTLWAKLALAGQADGIRRK